ncbi:class I SAM-dependent methyltransferase [bacterium]|nr:class I SAM-dependent methyltransferase [bacterium]
MNEEELKAQVKQYWNKRACGTEGSDSEKHSRKYFDELEDYKYSLESEIFSFAQFTRFHGQKVLEVGVGTGTDFLQWVRAGAEAYGLDLTEEAVEHVRNRLNVYGLEAKEIIVGDAENIPYPDNMFDLVYSWGVIHHSPDTIKALEEIIRVTRPGGKIKIMVYNRRSLITFFLYLHYGLFVKKPFRTISDILYHDIESIGTKAYTIQEFKNILARLPVQLKDISAKLRKVELKWIVPGYVRFLLRMVGFFMGHDKTGYFMTINLEKNDDIPPEKQ